MKVFFEIHSDNPREGPGDFDSTKRAFESLNNLPKNPVLLDIGCGPGKQTFDLLEISNIKISAVDNYQPYLDSIEEKVKIKNLENRLKVSNQDMTNLDFEQERFDIIWSEGALYFLGFQDGLKRCHQLLKDKGYLAVTELVYTVSNPPNAVVEYFGSEYPDINNIAGKIELIRKEGFGLISHFTLPESAWLDSYYLPIEKEIPRLHKKYQGNEVALSVFEGFKNEVDFYKKYSKFYGYEFFIMQKIG